MPVRFDERVQQVRLLRHRDSVREGQPPMYDISIFGVVGGAQARSSE